MKRHIWFVLLVLPFNAFTQMHNEAIIRESNSCVFREANIYSDTVYTLHKDEVFLIVENDKANSAWIYIKITRNKFTKIHENKEGIYKDLYITGFVPRSKVLLVDSLPNFTNNEIALKSTLARADTSGKNAENYLRYGLEIPLNISYVTTELILDYKGKLIKQDKILFDDLYNISFRQGIYSSKNNTRFKIYKHNESYFIKQKCGDGAGSYEITWVIKDGIIIQRIIDEI